ncbi:hypothetical protein K8R30_00465 [archaeon]|nr:hypothetical protein [archaeon]
MTIEKYVSGMRAGLNERARNLGNKIYDGLGDGLASDVDLVKGAKNGLIGVVALTVAGLSSGCVTPAGNRFGKSLVKAHMHSYVVRDAENRSDAQHDRGERVGSSPIEHKRKLIVQYWKDFNGNGKLDKGEVLGKVDGAVNLDEYGLSVDLKTTSISPITFFVLDSSGNKISQGRREGKKTWMGYTSSPKVTSGDWIDNLNGVSKESPGKYTIYVQQDECSEVFKKEINITRDLVELSND